MLGAVLLLESNTDNGNSLEESEHVRMRGKVSGSVS